MLEEASRIVIEREHAFQLLTIDLSFMAVLSADHQAADQIWQDAMGHDSAVLLDALIQAREAGLCPSPDTPVGSVGALAASHAPSLAPPQGSTSPKKPHVPGVRNEMEKG